MKRMMQRALALSAALVICGMCESSRADLFLVGDAGTNQIEMYNSTTGSYAPVALPGGNSFVTPFGLTFGPDSNLYFSSLGDGNVYKYNSSSTGFTSGGVFIPHGSGGLTYPNDIAFLPTASDPAGYRVLVTSYATNSIISYSSSGGDPQTLVTGLNGPTGLVVDSHGNVFVSSSLTNSVVELVGGVGPPVSIASGLDHPASLVISGTNLFVANFADDHPGAGSITRIDLSSPTHPATTFTLPGLMSPAGLAAGSTAGTLFVTNYASTSGTSGSILEFDLSGNFFGTTSLGAGSHPTYIVAIPGGIGFQQVPEPTSLALAGTGLALFVGYKLRRRRSSRTA